MQIIETPNLDLISPFPANELPRVYGWIAATQTIFVSDDSPKTQNDMTEYLRDYLPRVETFGVVDRDNWLKMKHPTPLVGIIIFEPHTSSNGYFHVACTRKACGTRVIDQALQGAINHLFTTHPINRLSASIPIGSYHAKAILKRAGFVREAVLPDMLTKDGHPADILHFGLLRRNIQWDSFPHWVKLLEPLARSAEPRSPAEQA